MRSISSTCIQAYSHSFAHSSVLHTPIRTFTRSPILPSASPYSHSCEPSRVRAFGHSCNRAFIRSFIQAISHSRPFDRSFIVSWNQRLIDSAIRRFADSLIHSFLHPPIRSFVHSHIHAFVRSGIHAFGLSFVRSFGHSFVRSYVNSTALSRMRSCF